MLGNPLPTSYLTVRLLVITPVAVEKLTSKKSAKIKTRQEALQTIFLSRLDIFSLPIFECFQKKGLFQQPRLFSPIVRYNPALEFALVVCLAVLV